MTLNQSLSSATVADHHSDVGIEDANPLGLFNIIQPRRLRLPLYCEGFQSLPDCDLTYRKASFIFVSHFPRRPISCVKLIHQSNDKPINMTTAADPRTNGNHEHILRPRAVKPMNPEVLRTLSEDGYFKPNGSNENGKTTAETRSKLSLLSSETLILKVL